MKNSFNADVIQYRYKFSTHVDQIQEQPHQCDLNERASWQTGLLRNEEAYNNNRFSQKDSER